MYVCKGSLGLGADEDDEAEPAGGASEAANLRHIGGEIFLL
jgi:hypothetical protein